MVVNKNTYLIKDSKEGAQKKVVGPFSKKDWYNVKVPVMVNIIDIGKTLVMRTQGT
ncbi:40S ribosomal protein S3a-like [Molossus molossus]|uniref:40S ribosomal protein S3a-like n=1 Tax=Molossus molossus TaxID=27622 RepID=UPI00174630A2|nr:40S ribosomal protein S3a-like [Molossus molossus]